MTPVYDDMGDEMIQDLELRHEQKLVGDEARLTAEALRVKFGIAAESVARAQMELADDDSLRQHWKGYARRTYDDLGAVKPPLMTQMPNSTFPLA